MKAHLKVHFSKHATLDGWFVSNCTGCLPKHFFHISVILFSFQIHNLLSLLLVVIVLVVVVMKLLGALFIVVFKLIDGMKTSSRLSK